MSVGSRIKSIRKEKGLTMEEFGKLIGDVEKSAVGNWERGDNFPNRKRTKRIAELGGISVDELLGSNLNKTVEETIYEIKETFTDEEIKQIIRSLI